MAERYEQNVDDKVVNTEPTPLDPSPKIPVSTDSSEGLSPNPHPTGETNVKGEHILEDKVVGTQPTQREDYIQLTRSQLIELIKQYSQESTLDDYVQKSPLQNKVYATGENGDTTLNYSKDVAGANSIVQRDEVGRVVVSQTQDSDPDNVATNKKYVDDKLALKANLDGANFTGDVTAPSIIENMSGYSFQEGNAGTACNIIFAGTCKNGNKLSLVLFGTYTRPSENAPVNPILGTFVLPRSVADKIVPYSENYSVMDLNICYSSGSSANKILLPGAVSKPTFTTLRINAYRVHENVLVVDTPYLFRIELTFLLNENLANQE